ncbi:MAG TPA: amidase, partial [Acidobacteriota bacterium]|nr:amidase [Acidobacteriota bacterium]
MRKPAKSLLIGLLCLFFFCFGLFVHSLAAVKNPITRWMVGQAENVIGLTFQDKDRTLMLDGLKEQLGNYEKIRKVELVNDVPPALSFNPIPAGYKPETVRKPFRSSPVPVVARPSQLEDVAFFSIGQLAGLIKSKKVTSEEL